MAGEPGERFRLPVAVHVFLMREADVLLLRRANTGYQDGNYSVPAGHLDGDETVWSAAARELREEIGVQVTPGDLSVVGVMHRREGDERIDVFLTTTRWDGEPTNAEPAKCDELRWAALDALPDNTIPYVRRALENARDGRWFDSFGWT